LTEYRKYLRKKKDDYPKRNLGELWKKLQVFFDPLVVLMINNFITKGYKYHLYFKLVVLFLHKNINVSSKFIPAILSRFERHKRNFGKKSAGKPRALEEKKATKFN